MRSQLTRCLTRFGVVAWRILVKVWVAMQPIRRKAWRQWLTFAREVLVVLGLYASLKLELWVSPQFSESQTGVALLFCVQGSLVLRGIELLLRRLVAVLRVARKLF